MEHMEITLAHNMPGVGKAGERVTLALTPSDTQTPDELSSYCAGYKNWEYAADKVAPVILVDKEQAYYRTFGSDNAFKPVNVRSSRNAKIAEIDPESSTEKYKVEPRTIGSFITEGLTGDSFDPKMAASRRCRNVVDMDREITVMQKMIGTSTSWNSNVRTALAAGYKWNGGADSNPIEAILTALDKSYAPVTDIYMNQYVATLFILHEKVRDYLRSMLGDSALSFASNQVSSRAEASMSIPGFPPIHIAKAKYNPSGTMGYIMPNVVSLLSTPPSPPTDGEEMSSAYTFRHRGSTGNGFVVREFRVEDRGLEGGEMIVVGMKDAEVMTGTTCGGIITGVVQ